MSNNSPETMTAQQRYCRRNTEKCQTKGRKNYAKNGF